MTTIITISRAIGSLKFVQGTSNFKADGKTL
jgi:hypothetical protein